MPGNFKPCIIFPFDFHGAKSARIQIEPFASLQCYGVIIKIILELTGGAGDNSFTYERTAMERYLLQENINDGFMSAPFIEVMEGFYYNKTEVHILIPVCAMLMKLYCDDVLDGFGINLDSYIVDIGNFKGDIGFKSKVNDVSNNAADQQSYQQSNTISSRCLQGNDEEKALLDCKQVIRSLQKKNSKY